MNGVYGNGSYKRGVHDCIPSPTGRRKSRRMTMN